jgi:serine/threonine-protein kinase RsbT
VGDPVTIQIASDEDVVGARRQGAALAAELGFGRGDQTVIAAAISEIARNILMYARIGEIELQSVPDGRCPGLAVVARDEGPGIRDIPQALQDGYSTSGGLGLGLPGARRLMDEFDVVSVPGQGTTITMKKWLRRNG